MDPKSGNQTFPRTIEQLERDDKLRSDFLKACLSKLGLRVNSGENTVPSLSRLHLTSFKPSDTAKVIESLREIITVDDGEEYIKDENDTFHLEKMSTWSMGSLSESLPKRSKEEADKDGGAAGEDRILDYNTVIKRLLTHDADYPSSKETPYFNHHAYYANLDHYHSMAKSSDPAFGRNLLYGEVVTSTNTMLEKYAKIPLPPAIVTLHLNQTRNTQILRRLPAGFTATATVQVAGRGRGTNVWVSPAGSLMFSIVVRHETSLTAKAPVVFLQYLAALAIVEGIKTYDKGYGNVPVRLKWPNDICT